MKSFLLGGTNLFRYLCVSLHQSIFSSVKRTTAQNKAIFDVELISWCFLYQQNYVAPGNDPYLSSYYGTSFPYQLDGAWSSNSVPGAGGAAEGGVAFLGGYGVQGGAGHHQDSYGIDGMFGSNGGFGNFGQPGFSGGYGLQGNGTTAAEYSTWERKAHYDDYYQPRGPDHHSVYQSSRLVLLSKLWSFSPFFSFGAFISKV